MPTTAETEAPAETEAAIATVSAETESLETTVPEKEQENETNTSEDGGTSSLVWETVKTVFPLLRSLAITAAIGLTIYFTVEKIREKLSH